MYTLPKSKYLKRSLVVNGRDRVFAMNVDPISHSERIKRELRLLGAPRYALWSSESRFLPHIIHPDEHIGGVVYGQHKDGFAMLVATDRRVFFLDKKPLFVNEDEINYRSISGVKVCHAGFGSMVILHTRTKDYTIRTYNTKCAETFVRYIESRCLLQVDSWEDYYDNFD